MNQMNKNLKFLNLILLQQQQLKNLIYRKNLLKLLHHKIVQIHLKNKKKYRIKITQKVIRRNLYKIKFQLN